MAIEMKKTKIELNKPIYLGTTIQDKSKGLMYKFYYVTLNQNMQTK